VPFHWVEATVNVTVKEIPEEAVDKSGSIRFVNITAEEFIVPEADVSRQYKVIYFNLLIATVYRRYLFYPQRR
jgi:hypothetical protein